MIADATTAVSRPVSGRNSAIVGTTLVVLLSLVGGCSSTPSTGETDQPPVSSSSRPAPGTDDESPDQPATDKYTQTWTKSYSTTNCDDWQDAMTDAQTWAAAADILTFGRNKIDGGTGLPPDSIITGFRDDITEGCTADVPGLIITDVAYGVYTIGHEQHKP